MWVSVLRTEETEGGRTEIMAAPCRDRGMENWREREVEMVGLEREMERENGDETDGDAE